MLQLPIGGRGKTPSRQLSGLQTREGGAAEKENTEDTKTTTGRVFSSNLTNPGLSFAEALPGSSKQQQLPQTCQVD
jgi:hypothetical protein